LYLCFRGRSADFRFRERGSGSGKKRPRLELHQKDLNLALSTGRALGVALPNTAIAQELFSACAAHGGAKWDHSALVRALESLANFEIGQTPPA